MLSKAAQKGRCRKGWPCAVNEDSGKYSQLLELEKSIAFSEWEIDVEPGKRGKPAALFGMKNHLLAAVRVAVCSGCSVV